MCVYVCICMGIYMYIHVCGYTWMYVHVEARARPQAPPLFFKGHLSCLLRHTLTVTWNLPRRLGYLASGSQRPICLHFPGLGSAGSPPSLGFYMTCVDCLGSLSSRDTSPPEPSPQPKASSFSHLHFTADRIVE